MRPPFVGVGTGRCGTNSLAAIVSACKNTWVGHEKYQFWWYQVTEEVGRMIKDFRNVGGDGIKLVGNVSQAYLRHVGHLRSAFHDLRVVCLHRDKESTVESFVQYGSHMIRPEDKKAWVDKWLDDGAKATAMKCFPLIDGITPRQAYGFYWELYESLMAKVEDPVLHLDVNDLNNDTKLTTLFDFLDIPESDRVYIEKRQFWTQDEVQDIRKEMARGRAG